MQWAPSIAVSHPGAASDTMETAATASRQWSQLWGQSGHPTALVSEEELPYLTSIPTSPLEVSLFLLSLCLTHRCDSLADLVWRNFQQIKQASNLYSHLPIDLPPEQQDLLPMLMNTIGKLLETLITRWASFLFSIHFQSLISPGFDRFVQFICYREAAASGAEKRLTLHSHCQVFDWKSIKPSYDGSSGYGHHCQVLSGAELIWTFAAFSCVLIVINSVTCLTVRNKQGASLRKSPALKV